MSLTIDKRELLVISLLLGIAILIGYFFLDYPLDDAFITYSYAYNLSHDQGFVYNLGEKILATTAPFYALLLAFLSSFFDHIPALNSSLQYNPYLDIRFSNLPRLSNMVGTLGLFSTALLTYLLGQRHNQPLLATAASFLIIFNPILVLSLGMETNVQMAAIALAFLFYDSRRSFLWGLAAGLATMIRADGVLVMAVLVGHCFWQNRSGWRNLLWPDIFAYLAIVIPFNLYLTIEFGSPIPNSLSAKLAQAYLGFPDYLSWALVWGRDFLVPDWAFLLMAAIAVFGFSLTIKQEKWLLPIFLWALLHTLAYATLGVAGYHWYYAPIALAAAWLVSLGIRRIYHWLTYRNIGREWSFSVTAMLLAIVFYGESNSLWKVARDLPGPKEALYQGVGTFLRASTVYDQPVAVMEVGIIGFYSQRPMIDFLGLLQKDVARALARGDIFWSIPRYLPEYLVLGNQNPLYSYYLDPNGWLSTAYEPYLTFTDPRSPTLLITVYQKSEEIPPPKIQGRELGYRLGRSIQLQSYDLGDSEVHPGQFLELTLYWQRTGPVADNLKIFAHLIDDQFQIYGAFDLDIHPPAWQIGEEVSIYHFLRVDATTPPGEYYIEVGIYDPQTLNRLPVFDSSGQPTGAEIVVLSPIQVLPRK